jgi:FixJ family two-component response regulator
MNMRDKNSGNSIMIVDDDFDVLFTLSSYLKEAGYQITKFSKPEDALTAIGAASFDVVISDIKMPRFTGIDILDAVQRHTPDTPLIFMTAYADLDTAITAIKKGAFDFLIKPLDYDLVSRTIAKACAVVRGNKLGKEYLEQLEQGVLKKTAELRNAMFELEAARKAAQRSSEAKSEFLALAGLELRSPLQDIAECQQQLRETQLSNAQLGFLGRATTATEKLQEIVERILAYPNLGSNQSAEIFRRFSLREITHETLHLLQSQAEQRGLVFTSTIDSALPDILQGDFLSFGQVLESLVGSAVRFAAEGGVAVLIGCRERKGEELLLQVTITVSSIDIPPDQIKDFFKVFSAERSRVTASPRGGDGGQTDAERVDLCLGGSLWLESTAEGGTSFCFTAAFQEG